MRWGARTRTGGSPIVVGWIVGALLAVGIGFSGASAAQDEPERPNILWLTSEDNGPQLGCYGDEFADTPNIDALAGRGMIYRHAWSNAPVCAPARTAILTGMYPTSLGAQHMRSMVSLPSNVLAYPRYLRQLGYYCTNNSKTDYNVAVDQVWDESSGRAHWKNRAAGQPFFAVFNFGTSHESRIRKRPHRQVHDPEKVRIPAYHPDTPEVRQDWAQYYDVVSLMDRQVGAALRELEEAGLADETIVFYYGDHGSGMPRSKRWPYDSGLRVPLVIHVPEKWKQLAPDEYSVGGHSERPVGFVDLAPTVLSLAGKKPPEHMQGRAFMGPHAAEPAGFVFGFRGRMDERCDLVRSVSDGRYVYVRNYMPHRIQGQHVEYMFQTPTTRVWKRLFDEGKLDDRQSAFWRPKAPEELYDLREDPDEVNNLVGDEAYAEVLDRMRSAHREHLTTIRDVGFLPENEIHQRSGTDSPREMARDDRRYPFALILDTAERASNGKSAETDLLIERLGSEDSAVRYWSATGLLIRGETAVQRGRTALRQAVSDPAPAARIVAAEALAAHGEPEDLGLALRTLLELADPRNNQVNVAILALNSIDLLDDKARPIHPRLRDLSVRPAPGTPSRYAGYPARLMTKILADLSRMP